jgi:large subunit ribosomal protein L25
MILDQTLEINPGDKPMSAEFVLYAEPRDVSGKGASRRLRRAGKVPAILYGAGREPEMLMLTHNELLKDLENEAFYSHILSVNLESRTELAILKDLQRHPFKPAILHVDLQRVSADEKIRVHVPLHFINQETSPGVKQQGGAVSHHLIDVEVVCLPKDLPEFIEVDIAGLELGDSIHLSDLRLPEGVEIPQLAQGLEQDVTVVSIHGRKSGGEGEEGDEQAEEV